MGRRWELLRSLEFVSQKVVHRGRIKFDAMMMKCFAHFWQSLNWNETFLYKAIQTVTLEGFHLVHRLDRRSGQEGGGILVFVAEEHKDSICHLEDGGEDEGEVCSIWESAVL